jgi:undecaprenyl-diphosphatase
MNDIFASIFLGIVQGFTEFLPISSSGHLIVIPQLFGWEGVVDSLSFDVALHLGTVLALLVFFWKDWVNLTSAFFISVIKERERLFTDENSRLFVFIILGSIPAAIIGLTFKDFIEENTRSAVLVGINLIFFGLVMFMVDRYFEQRKSLNRVGFVDSLIVGVGQAISLIPGVSRSGVTITAGRLRNLDRETAVKFSFLLSTPAILGAGLLTAKDLVEVGNSGNELIFLSGFLASAISGWIAIKFLLAFVRTRSLAIFVIYRIVVGTILIVWSITRT